MDKYINRTNYWNSNKVEYSSFSTFQAFMANKNIGKQNKSINSSCVGSCNCYGDCSGGSCSSCSECS